ncbi:PHP domain-containing protein [Bacillota bacterium HCP28S3_F12]
MEYMNYHKHSEYSSVCGGMPDSATKQEEYIKKAVEYGHHSYFTTEHGNCGDIFEAFTLCQQYGIDCYVGLEGYIVADASSKDTSNYHIIIIPKTESARKKVNVINSHAHMTGYYYKPRIDVRELLTLDKNDVFITTACEAGILRDKDGFKNIFLPLYKHFGENLMLEIQNHKTDSTRAYTERALKLHDKLGLRIIAANDSHAVDADGLERRRQLLLGKRISYGNEDTYILDYPDYDTMVGRFVEQGVVTKEQAIEAINNTMIFKECEPLYLDTEIKMPTIYPNLTPEERVKELKRQVSIRFKNVIKEDGITKEELPMYVEGLRKEMGIIEETNEVCHTADYFLLDTKIVELATNKYGGCITRTGRGSCGAFYTNRVLGLTQLDRFKIKLPSFPERFMSAARLINQRSLPDVDINCSRQEPFVQATRELLGEHGCYPMVAYGELKESEAFRNVCRSHDLDFSDFNEVGKNLDAYRDDPKWKPYIDECQKYVGIKVSASVHPCAHILSNKNILEEYGVVRCGDALCVMITSVEADQYKVLKNDYLIVSVWSLINDTCKLAGIKIPVFNNLLKKIDHDPKVWDLVKNGLTCTINQMDTDNGKQQAMKYGVSSFEEAAMLSAAIRPSFDAWREKFLNRENYSTGSEALDNIFEMTHHYLLFQENLMQYFEWLGITPAESIGLIKKISKKKIHPEDFANLETRLKEGWIKQNGSDYMFDETWKMIQGCMSYGYCSMHGAAVGGDACYGLYLKAYYPLEYYTVCFNQYKKDERTTRILKNELSYFDIKLEGVSFGHSKGEYVFNRDTKTIYKGLGGIKYLNDRIADELYTIGQDSYGSFLDVLVALQDTSVNSKQLDILIKLDYFHDYGEPNELLKIVELFNAIYGKKQFAKSKIEDIGIPVEVIEADSSKKTEKTYGGFDSAQVLMDTIDYYKDHGMMPKTSLMDRITYQQEHYGYIQIVVPKVRAGVAFVQSVEGERKRTVTLYRLKTGETEIVRVREKQFDSNPFEVGQIIETLECSEEKRWKRNAETGEFYQIDDLETILRKWNIVRC